MTTSSVSVSPDIIDAAIEGNPHAIAHIFRVTKPMLRIYVTGKIGQFRPREIDDVVSETYVRMIRNLPTYVDTGKDIMAWLVTIARNLIFDLAKSARMQRESLTGDFYSEYDDSDISKKQAFPDAESLALTNIEQAERIVHIEESMAKITDPQRDVITCRFMRDMSTEETCDALGMNEGQVKALQYRAVRSMARNIGHYYQPVKKEQWV